MEYNILDDQAKQPATKRKPQVERAKVLRETRLIPKVILAIENFNKHIILLSKKAKTNDRLANYLHFGAVRDFNIKSGDLMAVIERTYSHSSQIEVSDSNLENVEDEHEQEQDVAGFVASDDDAESVAYEYDDNNDDAEPNQEKEKEEEEEEQQVKKQSKKTKKQAGKPVQKKVEKAAEALAENKAKKKVEMPAKKPAEKSSDTQAEKKVTKETEKQSKKQQETAGKAQRRRRVLSSDEAEEVEASPPKRRRGRTIKK